MMKNDYEKLIVSECEDASKIVEYILDYAAADSNYKFSVRFKFHLVPFSYGECTEKLYINHLERFFHTDPSSDDILYPAPDIADMRKLFENQSVDVDTMVVSPDDIVGDLLRLLPEIKQNHSIEGRAAILILEGDIGLPDVEKPMLGI